MHDVTLDVISFWKNDLSLEDPVEFVNLASNPADSIVNSETVSTSLYDAVIMEDEEVVLFLRESDIAWRNSGTITITGIIGLCQGIYRVDSSDNLTNCNPDDRSETLADLEAAVSP